MWCPCRSCHRLYNSRHPPGRRAVPSAFAPRKTPGATPARRPGPPANKCGPPAAPAIACTTAGPRRGGGRCHRPAPREHHGAQHRRDAGAGPGGPGGSIGRRDADLREHAQRSAVCGPPDRPTGPARRRCGESGHRRVARPLVRPCGACCRGCSCMAAVATGRELHGKVAAVTGAASGIGFASAKAMAYAGAHVVLIDRDEKALDKTCAAIGAQASPLVLDLLDTKQCASLLARTLAIAGQLDIFHANAGLYVGGDLVDADPDAIDRMLNLNVNVVMKNVHNVLPHMIERGTGDIIVTSSLAAHFPTPWEPVYASSKWAVNCFVQTVRRQVFKHGIRVGSISTGPVITSLLADWPAEKLAEAKASGSLIEASEVADVVLFMLTRPRGMTIRDVVMMPTNFDL